MKRNDFGGRLVPPILVLSMLVGCNSTQMETVDQVSADSDQAIDVAEMQPAVDQGSAEPDQAIAAAEAAIAKANANNWIWRDTEKFLEEAQDAYAKGDGDTAAKLANMARNQAGMAVNQYYLEQAKIMFDKASAVQGLNTNQQNALSEASKAIAKAEGSKAYDLLTPLLADIRAASVQPTILTRGH